MAVGRAAGEGINDLFNFSGDNVATGKIRIIEDGAEQSFSQEMLYQHFVNDIRTDFGVKRLAAKLCKRIKRCNEFLIELIFSFNDCQQCSRKFRDTFLKLLYCYLEGGNI